MKIDISLVRLLIDQQFPQWADLPISPVVTSGWDNRTFHLGEHMSIRLPSAAKYASQVDKEQRWLPKLQPNVLLMIPKPIAVGEPSNEYPWHWSIYEWLEGEAASIEGIADLSKFSKKLAYFLQALQQCETKGAPVAGPDNFFRGGDLKVYDAETRKAIAKIEDRKQSNTFTRIWEKALASSWKHEPVWVHGDIAVDNLLVKDGELNAVIDFGQLAVGDPSCDLVLYWTFFTGQNKDVFKKTLNLDADTWDRGRGWVLWKTLCAPISGTNCQKVLKCVIDDFD